MELILVVALVVTTLGWPVILWLCLQRKGEHEIRVMERMAVTYEKGILMGREQVNFDIAQQFETLRNAEKPPEPVSKSDPSRFVDVEDLAGRPSHEDAVTLGTRR